MNPVIAILLMLIFCAAPVGAAPLRSVRVIFFGDLRPSCHKESPEEWARLEASISQVVTSLRATAPDLVVVNGDYGCAWPDEPQKARAQYGRLVKVLRGAAGDVFPKFHFTQGNHEAGHEELMRVFFGDEPRWSVTVAGLRVVAAPSDYSWGRGAGSAVDNRQWLTAALTPSTDVAVTIFTRHEPWNDTIRHDARFDQEVRPIVERAAPALLVFSHEHTYRRSGPRALISGNGGAPGWDAPGSAGYLGFIQVDTIPSRRVLLVTSFQALPGGERVARDSFEVSIP